MTEYNFYITSEDENRGFWYQRTKLEKTLIISLIAVLSISIGLVFRLILVTKSTNRTSDQIGLICESGECLTAAAEIQSSLDTSADPCHDFYQYACGGWIRKNSIPLDRSIWSRFDVTSKKLLDDLRVILDGEVNDTYPEAIGKTVNVYKDCLNLTKRESDGIQELKNLVLELEWPMINQGNITPDYDWARTYAQLNKEHGLNFILSNYVNLDAKNTSIYSIYVDKPSFGVGREQLTKPDDENNKKILEAYKLYIRDTVKYFNNESHSSLDQDIEALIDFEKRLANISSKPTDRRNRSELYGNKTNLNDFTSNYYGIPLISIEEQVFKDIPGANISGDTPLIVYDRAYFERLGLELAKTDTKIIANYLSWRTVQTFGEYTTKAMRDIQLQFKKVVYGVKEQKPLWETCVRTAQNMYYNAVGRLYVDQHFTKQAKQDMNQMIDQLNVAFKQLLEEQNDWMERETKDRALNKLDKLVRAIGFPDFIMDDKLLDQYYKNYNFNDSNSYFKSISTIYQFLVQKQLQKLNTLNNRTEYEWRTGPAIVNAFFNPDVNRITFPAGILQSPFYTFGLPISMNLGAIGLVIGHEITHSFDDRGSQYDEYGNLHNWWDDITKERFNKRVKCFEDQYSSYNDSLAGRPVNGKLTIGENIADNGGLRQAFRALEMYSGSKPLLPASMRSFTNEQLFFLSFANVWCTNVRKETLIRQLETDPHSPGKYRVWGSVSNSESFAKAFNCKTNTKMNPKSKCVLW